MNKEKLIKLLSKGIDVNQYSILEMISKGEDLSSITESKVSGWILLLKKKQLLDENGSVSVQGSFLLSEIAGVEENAVEKEETDVRPVLSFNQYCTNLFEKIKEKIKELTGNKQGQHTNPSGQYLRPSSVKELQEQILKFANKYNYKDLGRIEEEILKHVEYAIKVNHNGIKDKYVRSVYYFIMKKDFPSELLRKLNNETKDETKIDTVSEDTFVNI